MCIITLKIYTHDQNAYILLVDVPVSGGGINLLITFGQYKTQFHILRGFYLVLLFISCILHNQYMWESIIEIQ